MVLNNFLYYLNCYQMKQVLVLLFYHISIIIFIFVYTDSVRLTKGIDFEVLQSH